MLCLPTHAHALNDQIQKAHSSFFEAGADLAIAATYQASRDSFARVGLSGEAADSLIRLGCQLAAQARDRWWADYQAKPSCGWRRHRPLVAASVGPYGASRADGSEYRGQYCEVVSSASGQERGPPLTALWLSEWHRSRLEILASCPGVDVLACETVPSIVEVSARTGSSTSSSFFFLKGEACTDKLMCHFSWWGCSAPSSRLSFAPSTLFPVTYLLHGFHFRAATMPTSTTVLALLVGSTPSSPYKWRVTGMWKCT